MKPSSSPSASTLVRAAALAMAVPGLLLPMKAAAQQMAANTPDFSRCDQISRTDPKSAISCRVDVIKAQGAAADVRVAAADARISESDRLRGCISFLGSKKQAGVELSPDRLTPKAACAYAAELGMK